MLNNKILLFLIMILNSFSMMHAMEGSQAQQSLQSLSLSEMLIQREIEQKKDKINQNNNFIGIIVRDDMAKQNPELAQFIQRLIKENTELENDIIDLQIQLMNHDEA